MKVEQKYISIGVNRSSSCAACTNTGLLAFAAGRFVALWDTESSTGIYATLVGHEGPVTVVKLLRDHSGSVRIVSGDAEGAVRLWDETSPGQFTCSASWKAHTGSISAIGVPPNADGVLRAHVFTGGSDGTIKLWDLAPEQPALVQTINPKGKLPLDIEVAYLPGSQVPVLAIACTERRIQLWTQQGQTFELAISLEGHEDWVRSLSFTAYPSATSPGSTDLLLASGSQDNYIRLWRFASTDLPVDRNTRAPNTDGDDQNGLDLLDEFEKKLGGDGPGSMQISTKAHVLAVAQGDQQLRFNVTLEALLVGHEAGLTNVHFSPSRPDGRPIQILSTSSDNSLIVWSATSHASTADGIWIPSSRFGAVGGRGLAFYGALWGKDGQSVLGAGWNGGWERWCRSEGDTGGDDKWEVKAAVMGHFGEVKSIEWSPNGEYLLSVGSDQTSRIHASCDPSQGGPSSTATWAEIARPQIHGYDMTSAAWLGSLRFASGADEKVTRVFDAPRGFVESLDGLNVASSSKRTLDIESRPKGATVPPLGLSNRALGKAPEPNVMHEATNSAHAHDSVAQALTSLPTEEELATSTLWPEIEKVYGHGYEITTLAASHDAAVLASACKATTAEHAVVRLHSTTTWDSLGAPLAGHTLTVTRIALSPDDRRILTCSRDRGWRVFRRRSDVLEDGYELEASDEKAHARMVLDCCWLPDGQTFVTASRDKTVKLWTRATADSSWLCKETIKLPDAVTAVDASQHGDQTVLAIGLDSGAIHVYAMCKEGSSSSELGRLDSSISHCATVNRVAWNPHPQQDGSLQLATCSDDRSVRIYRVVL